MTQIKKQQQQTQRKKQKNTSNFCHINIGDKNYTFFSILCPIIYHSKTSSHPRRRNSVLEFEKAVLGLEQFLAICVSFFFTKLI